MTAVPADREPADAGLADTEPANTDKASNPAVVIRIIPCLDVDDGRVVKGVNFIGLRDAGDPIELAEFYSSEGADELVFLDITASSDERDTTGSPSSPDCLPSAYTFHCRRRHPLRR